MEYVEIINSGLCYPSLVNDSSNRLLFNVMRPNNNRTPRNGDVGYVIETVSDDARFHGQTLKTIACSDGFDYIMGSAGIVNISESFYNASIEKLEVKKVPPKPKALTQQPAAPEQSHRIGVGDIIECIDPAAGGYGKQWQVTMLDSIGYDLLVGKIGNKGAVYGYKFRQVKKVMPELEIPDENKPQFSRKELLDVLNQEKSAEEIILDLMDHITN